MIVAHHDEGLGEDIGEIERGFVGKRRSVALLRRWPRIGVWLRTKANGFLQALMG